MGDLFGSGGVSNYPTTVDTATTQTDVAGAGAFGTTSTHSSKPNNLATALIAIESLLGIVGASGFNAGPRVIGNKSLNNAGTPNTQWDLVADGVVLRSPAPSSTVTAFVYRDNPGTITNNVSTAGPAANVRDQAGAFSASSWIHFYWIWNGTTLASVSSAVAPPTGPTLPATYTHWAYCGAVRFSGASALLKTRIRGCWATYEAAVNVLNNGAATTTTAIDLTATVPPNALNIQLIREYHGGISDGAGALSLNTFLEVVSGSTYSLTAFSLAGLAASTSQYVTGATIIIPNIGQNVNYYTTLVIGTAPYVTYDVSGYSLPNGGE